MEKWSNGMVENPKFILLELKAFDEKESFTMKKIWKEIMLIEGLNNL